MKKTFVRSMSIVIVLVSILSPIHIINTFAIDEPELSVKCETLINDEVKEGNFGTILTGLRTSTTTKLSSPINLTSADFFEFDVYIEDIDALNVAFENFFEVNFYFSSNARVATANRAYANISDQLVESGWNHIEIEQSQFIENNINWGSVRYYYIAFSNEKDGSLPDKLQNSIVKIDNVCESFLTPVLEEGDLVLFDDLVFGKWGESENSPLTDISKTFNIATNQSDISSATFLKVDLLISSLPDFDSFVSNKTIKFVLSSAGGEAECVFDGVYFPTKVSNWYTVKMPINNFIADDGFDITKVSNFRIEVECETETTVGSIYATKFAFANVRGEIEREIMFGEVVENYNVHQKVIKFGNTFGDFTLNVNSDFSAISDAEYIEFDLYVNAFDSFKKFFIYDNKNNAVNASLDLVLTQGTATIKWTGLEDLISTKGLNHVVLEVDEAQNNGFKGSEKFDSIEFCVSGVESTVESANFGDFIIIDKLVSSKGISAKLPDNFDVTFISGLAKKGTYGTPTSTESVIAYQIIDYANLKNISDCSYLEFDYFVDDITKLKEKLTALSVKIVAANNYNGKLISFIDQLTQNGWNHVRIKTSDLKNYGNGTLNLEKVQDVRFYQTFAESALNVEFADRYAIANVVGTPAEYLVVPALPDNVVSILGDENGTFFAGNTVGQKYHFTLDRIYKERFQPIDFSKTNKIEFDIYVDDYEKFLAAENDPNNKNAQLAFEVSSTPPALWDQYRAPRHYYSSAILVAPYITHSGWNHIVVGKQDFIPINNGGVDWSVITAFLVFYKGSSNYYPVDNAYSDLYIRVVNVVNTGIAAHVPTDADKPLQNDESAVYMNSAEGMVDDVSAWNTFDGHISTDYKTEGKASIHQSVDYTKNIDDTKMSLIFDSTVDMTDIKTLKFDYFLDIPQFLNKGENTLQIVLGADRQNNNYYYWELSPDNFNAGWNEVSLDIADAKSFGEPNLDAIKVVSFSFSKLSLDIENFAVITVGVDNLRYISKSGNKILKIEGWDDIESDVSSENKNEENLDLNEDNNEIIEEENIENVQKIETLVNKTGEVKYNKILENQTITNYTVLIILISFAAAVVVGVVIFTIVFEKKIKKSN